MAYSDVSGKIITRAFGKFRGTAFVAVVPGNLLARDTTNEGWILADESDASVAEAVAVETIAAGAEGWMALACEIKAPPTIATGGVVTAGALAIADDVCDALYLADGGLASDTEGSTTVQQVGFILSTERALLMPNVGITGTAISSTTLTTSGNATVGGALAVTGASTLTGATTVTGLITANGGLTLGSGDFVSGAPTKMTITSKAIDALLTAAEAGVILVTADAKTMTLPAASGNSGLRYIIKHTAATHTTGTTVDANASETIDGATTVVLNAQYDYVDIVCDGTGWHVIGKTITTEGT